MPKDPMDVDEVLRRLNVALRLQYRSALQYTLVSGGMLGLTGQSVAGEFATFADQELHDARRIVEKIAALGGDPTTEVAPLRWNHDAIATIDGLIDDETENIDALHAVIPPSGQEGRSEALEHLMEHLIMRKQNQVDLLLRIQRGLD